MIYDVHSNLLTYSWSFMVVNRVSFFLCIGMHAVTKAKLGYDPLEVNLEDMVRFAMEEP